MENGLDRSDGRGEVAPLPTPLPVVRNDSLVFAQFGEVLYKANKHLRCRITVKFQGLQLLLAWSYLWIHNQNQFCKILFDQ